MARSCRGLSRSRGDRLPAARTTRSVGSLVIMVNGALAHYLSRGARQLQVFLPDDEPARSTVARAVADGCGDRRAPAPDRRSQRRAVA
jgi:ATP-dependent Lhr-like helicase